MSRHYQFAVLLLGGVLAAAATQCTSFDADDPVTTDAATGAEAGLVDTSAPTDAGATPSCTLEFIDDFERTNIGDSGIWSGAPSQAAGATLNINADHYRGQYGARAILPGDAGTSAYLERTLGMRNRVRLSFAVHGPTVFQRTVTFSSISISSLKVSLYFSLTKDVLELREQDLRANSTTVTPYPLGKVSTDWHFVTLTLDLAGPKAAAKVDVDGETRFMAALKYQWAPGVVSLRAGTTFASPGEGALISFDDVGVCTEP